MQIIKSNNNIVEKILRDKNGRLVRAKFCIYESAQGLKARLIDISYIDEIKTITGKVLSISGNVSKAIRNKFIKITRTYSTPIYFILNYIFYSGSKPRAPSF